MSTLKIKNKIQLNLTEEEIEILYSTLDIGDLLSKSLYHISICEKEIESIDSSEWDYDDQFIHDKLTTIIKHNVLTDSVKRTTAASIYQHFVYQLKDNKNPILNSLQLYAIREMLFEILSNENNNNQIVLENILSKIQHSIGWSTICNIQKNLKFIDTYTYIETVCKENKNEEIVIQLTKSYFIF